MTEKISYLSHPHSHAVADIVKGIDRDVEKGEDALMLGFGLAILSSIFAPIAPPVVLLPMVALTFTISACFARLNYYKMQKKLFDSVQHLDRQQKALIDPIVSVFIDYPVVPLVESFNPLMNLRRIWKCVFGGIIMNPLWIPIFYVMGMQITEEKNLGLLNKAIIGVDKKSLSLI
jgi:hypothetical protein